MSPWYDALNPWHGRDTGSRGDYQLPGYADRAAGLQAAYGGAYGGARDPNAGAGFRNDQRAVLDRLHRQMNGQDSQSAAELQRSYGQATGNQLGIAASARPGQGPMAARIAAQNVGRMQAGMAGDQALAGIAERNAATGMYGQLAGMARGQDMQQLGQNDAYNLALRQQELANAGQQQAGNIAYNQVRAAQPSPFEQTAALFEGIGKGAGLGGGKKDDGGMGGGDASSLAALAMKDGGVVTKPTHALVGEAGPEAVIPLAKLPDLVGKLAKMMQAPAEDAGPRGEPGSALPAPKMVAPPPARPAPTPGQFYGPSPNTPYYGPPVQPTPASQQPWRASSPKESALYNAGVDAARQRAKNVGDPDEGGFGRTRAGTGENNPNTIFKGGVPKMTVGEWTAFLHGLGVQ
jgi:hypothetical protein